MSTSCLIIIRRDFILPFLFTSQDDIMGKWWKFNLSWFKEHNFHPFFICGISCVNYFVIVLFNPIQLTIIIRTLIFASFKCQVRNKSKIENSISNKNSKTSKYKTSKDWRGKIENTLYTMIQKILSSKFNNIVNGVVN